MLNSGKEQTAGSARFERQKLLDKYGDIPG